MLWTKTREPMWDLKSERDWEFAINIGENQAVYVRVCAYVCVDYGWEEKKEPE